MSQHQFEFGDYTIRSMSRDDFQPLFQKHRSQAFADTFTFRLGKTLSAEQETTRKRLRARENDLYRLRLAIFHGTDFVGWHVGRQTSADEYAMTNSAVLPAHQRQGLYTFLLARVLDIVRDEGFQVVTSGHNATNNRIIIPKLKAGFVITGMEISAEFGAVVKLTYFFHPLRRHALDVRSGEAVPNEELRQYMPL